MNKVGIAGAGGIGGNVAVHLVRSGVKELKIVDFDTVDLSNLNRQFYFRDQIGKPKVEMIRENLLRIMPDLNLEIENVKLTRENLGKTFEGCPIIIEGFDRADAKAMLLETFAGTDKTVVSACGLAGLDISSIRTEKRFGNTWIIGDFETDIRDKKLYSPKVFIAASMMANIVLKELGFEDRIK